MVSKIPNAKRRQRDDSHRPGTPLFEEPPEVRTGYSQHGNNTNDTHGHGGSVAIRPNGEVTRLWVGVLWSVVTHY